MSMTSAAGFLLRRAGLVLPLALFFLSSCNKEPTVARPTVKAEKPLGRVRANSLGELTSITLGPNNTRNQFQQVIGYYGPEVILAAQWGPAFANINTGTVWTDMVSNCEYLGMGRVPCPVHLDVHGCCNVGGVAGGTLYVPITRVPPPPEGSAVAYSIDPPAFSGF